MDIKTSIKVVAVVFLGFFMQSCVTNGTFESKKLEHFDECFRKTNGKFIEIRCPSNERPILTTSQRLRSLERFKDFLANSEEKTLELEKLHEHYPDGFFSNEHSPQGLDMLAGDKFIISLTFRNYSLFPTKSYDDEAFTNDSSIAFKEKWENIIFRRYLGEDYKHYEPALGIVHDDWIVIRVLVNGISELEDIIYRDPLRNIKHVGDPVIIEWIVPTHD